MSPFTRLHSFYLDHAPVKFSLWKSPRTGLLLSVLHQETPIIQGEFTLATEVADDSGTPHTLEHLVFMGSQKYPFKGLLDLVSGIYCGDTNAETRVDSTIYSLQAVGWHSFQKLLPMYLDHVLYPTLSDEACYTEVHHVDGEGKDKGVVYSEMEGMVTTSWFLAALETQREMYHANSGYSSETGGLLDKLRCLTNQQIKDFHKKMYRADNLYVSVAGSVDEEEFLTTMEQFDRTLPDASGLPRPFVETGPHFKLEKSVKKTVEFADLDEDSGSVQISWFGKEFGSFVENSGTDMMFRYLVFDSTSYLQKHIVEVDPPLAYEVSFSAHFSLKAEFSLELEGVPVDKLDVCEQTVLSLLRQYLQSDEFDLAKLRDFVNCCEESYDSSCETDPGHLMAQSYSQFMYGPDDMSGFTQMKNSLSYRELEKWTKKEWLNCISEMLESPLVTILCKPSAKLYHKNAAEDERRFKERRDKLGEAGLKELAKKLQKVEQINNKPVPDSVLKQFGSPDISKINFIKTYFVSTLNEKGYHKSQKKFHDALISNLPPNFPLDIHFANYKSHFFHLNFVFSTHVIPPELVPYIKLFRYITSMPMKVGGRQYTFEETLELNRNLFIRDSFSPGFDDSFVEILTFHVQAKSTRYKQVIDHVANLFFNTVFDSNRIKILLETYLNSLSDCKRDGEYILSHYSNLKMSSGDRPLSNSYNMYHVEPFAKQVLHELETEGFAAIEAKLEQIRGYLFKQLNNYRVSVFGGIPHDHPVDYFQRFIDKSGWDGKPVNTVKVPKLSDCYDHDIIQDCFGQGYLVGVPGSESSYGESFASFKLKWNDPDFAAFRLAISYLGLNEGPLWKAIRGGGYAYGGFISFDFDDETVYLQFTRATDFLGAFEAVKQVILGYVEGKTEINDIMMGAAISSVVLGVSSVTKDVSKSATNGYLNEMLRQWPADVDIQVLEKLGKVTKQEMIAAMKKYLMPIFEPQSSVIFLAMNPKHKGIVGDIEKMGYDVEYTEGDIGSDESGSESGSEESGSENSGSEESGSEESENN